MRRDAEERHERIVAAARELYCALPPERVTHTAVAERAGVGIATLYRHFPDRDRLGEAVAVDVLHRAVDLLEDRLAEARAAGEGDGRRPAIRAAWEGAIDGLVELGIGPLVPALAPESFEQLSPPAVELKNAAERALGGLVSLAAEAGLVHPGLTTRRLIATLIVCTRPPTPGVKELEPQVGAVLVRLLLRGGWAQDPGE